MPHEAGFSQNGLPYVRVGEGAERLVIFTSGSPDDSLPSGFLLKMFVDGASAFAERYRVYFIKRVQGMAPGYTTADMARDYAGMIRDEIGAPCHLIGISAGGFIAQHFAVDYPELVVKLVIAIAGYRLEGEGRRIVEGWRALAQEKRMGALMASMYRSVTRKRMARLVATIGGYVAGPILGRRVRDLGDFVVTLDALLAHDGWDLLPEIGAPTLVVGGDQDVFYPREMLEAMHARTPGSQLALYPGVGHGALEFRKDEFDRDVIRFLIE